MPWTIYRYILWDLVKLLFVSTSVLVTVISFAAAIKPLSDGLLSAGSLLKFVGYTAPTMLAFVLPFAGAFAATIVFLRLASDNELTAMSASGMSYGSILAPVVALGLVLTMGLFLLSNFVIPNFYRAAAQTLEQDLLSVLVSRLDQSQPFELDEYLLYADAAAQRPLTEAERARFEGTPPSQVIQLEGVAVGRVTPDGGLRHEMTAERATALVYRGEEASWITIQLAEGMRIDPRGGLARAETAFFGPFALPTPLRDQPEFLSWRQLRRLREQPERYAEIRRLREELADAVAAEQLRLLLISRLRGDGGAGRVELRGGQEEQRFVLSSPLVRREGADLVMRAVGDRPVVVEAHFAGQPPRRFEAEAADVTIQRSPGAPEPSVLAELLRTKVFLGEERQPSTERVELALPRMFWPGPVLPSDIDRLSALELLEFVKTPVYQKSRPVVAAARALWNRILVLGHRIKAQLHQRAASAVACSLVLVVGAILSMTHRHAMSLVVYFWAFALAIVTVIIIHTGTNLAGSPKESLVLGLLILWSGNIGLATIAGVLYCRLART